MVKNLPALHCSPWGPEDPLEKGLVTHSSRRAWRIPGTEQPGGLQAVGSPRVRHDRAIDTPLCSSGSATVCSDRPALQAPASMPALHREAHSLLGMVLMGQSSHSFCGEGYFSRLCSEQSFQSGPAGISPHPFQKPTRLWLQIAGTPGKGVRLGARASRSRSPASNLCSIFLCLSHTDTSASWAENIKEAQVGHSFLCSKSEQCCKGLFLNLTDRNTHTEARLCNAFGLLGRSFLQTSVTPSFDHYRVVN